MLYRYIFILDIKLNRISESLRCLAPVLDVCKTENPTRDTTHGGACLEAPRSKQYVAPVGSASAGVGSSRSRQRSRKCSCAADRSFSVASRHLAIKACGVTRKCSCGKAAASGGCCENYRSMSCPRLRILFWIRLSMRPSTRSGRSPSFRFCSASETDQGSHEAASLGAAGARRID